MSRTMAKVDVRPRAILALDIECDGEDTINNRILSIGFCLGIATSHEIIECGRVSMQPLPGQVVEERCMTEFWSKFPHVRAQLDKEAVPAGTAIARFNEMLASWDEQYQVYIAADNPAFDLGRINYYLSYFGYRPLCRDRHTGEYRNYYDTDCFARGVRALDYFNPWTGDLDTARDLGFEITTMATHFPDVDACHVYEVHIKTVLAAVANRNRASASGHASGQ